MMNESRLKQILDGFPELRIAVIGDFFLDKWLLIDRSIDEPSLETGLTAYQVTGKRLCPGAAGTVTNNLSALDVGEIYAVGFAGDDGEGYELIQGLNRTRVKTDYLFQYEGVFTPTYIKPLFNYEPQPEEANRLDIRNRGITPAFIEDKLISSLYEVSKKVDAIIALDQVVEQNTGVITGNMIKALAELGKASPELIIYADSRAHTADFRNVIVKCNHLEAMRASEPDYEGEADEAAVKTFAKSMAVRTGRQVFVTWGQNGTVAVKGNETVLVPAVKVEGPIDICGAGDAATSGIVSALSRGASEEEAALIANLAASITIQQIGTTGTASRKEIHQRFKILQNGNN
jgi:bifunctional ADP-heptose synthase (sugar kinase/adenylyltransferase)